MDKMSGTGNAKLISHGRIRHCDDRQPRRYLLFNQEGESVLATAIATGNGNVESKPARSERRYGDTKILKADTLDLHMSPGGKDLDHINTQVPGTLEFCLIRLRVTTAF